MTTATMATNSGYLIDAATTGTDMERTKRRRRQLSYSWMSNLLILIIFSLISHIDGFSLQTITTSSGVGTAVLRLGNSLDGLYDKSSLIKCPFFRRRAADAIDNTAMLFHFFLIRHKSLPWISDLLADPDYSPELFSCPGCKPYGRHIKRLADGTAEKTRHLTLGEVEGRIHYDWVGAGVTDRRGYYITGKLDSTIYTDDCLFKSPDPDMPVRGLRKYLSAAAQLFDQRQSCAELLSISSTDGGGEMGHGIVEVTWRLSGIINLPWHPTVEPWTGSTRYHLDSDGLIYMHEEQWDISVWRAFICTLFPEAREWIIWKRSDN